MVQHPPFLYGTAWKEDQTKDLVGKALRAGFRGIDTANQRKHYFEAAVGEAVADFLAQTGSRRDELFLQTKYTFAPGQDHRLPYDPKAPYGEQVEQSFASSLQHLHTTYLDSYVLHGPMLRQGLSDADWEAWGAMEKLQLAGKAKHLGVSNVSLAQLAALYDGATVKPVFVQNRCFARQRWDRDVRDFCSGRGLVYQGFSLLTANAAELQTPPLLALVRRKECTLAQSVFKFAIGVGMLPLTGTSSEQHMRQDLDAMGVELSPDEIAMIENVAV
jgi:diketogulonate reductase-like aldo/keto reductase